MEATGGYERTLMEALHAAGVPVSVVQPLRVRRFAEAEGKHAKNDRVDAAVLARFGQAMKPAPTPKPEAIREKLREYLELHVQLDENLTRTRNQLDSTHDREVRKIVESSLKHLEKQMKKVNQQIEKVRMEDTDLKRYSGVLEAVGGVGKITSATLLSMLPELGHVNRQQITALVGLAPYDHESGQWKGKRTIFGGRSAVRRVMYMAAMVGGARGFDPVLARTYKSMIACGRPAKVAIIACARKLLVYLNGLMRKALIEAGKLAPGNPASPALPAVV